MTNSGHAGGRSRSEEHTSELQSRGHLVCRLLLEKKNQFFTDPFAIIKDIRVRGIIHFFKVGVGDETWARNRIYPFHCVYHLLAPSTAEYYELLCVESLVY